MQLKMVKAMHNTGLFVCCVFVFTHMPSLERKETQRAEERATWQTDRGEAQINVGVVGSSVWPGWPVSVPRLIAGLAPSRRSALSYCSCL